MGVDYFKDDLGYKRIQDAARSGGLPDPFENDLNESPLEAGTDLNIYARDVKELNLCDKNFFAD